jgi:quinol monooxygenase YgiN
MFERYTERARRVLFFARYEASQLGSPSIGPEHLLLGILHEGGGLAARICRDAGLDFLLVHLEVARAFEDRPKISTSVEMPLSAPSKAALKLAEAEADALKHAHIGTEHLLLALLAEPESLAGGILTRGGLRLEPARAVVRSLYGTPSVAVPSAAAPQPAPTREAHIVLVQVTIRPEMQEAFERALLHNASESVRLDRGCLRFDVSQDKEDPAKWVLYEVYDSPAAHAAHRESAHFLAYDEVATAAVVEKVVSKCAARHVT